MLPLWLYGSRSYVCTETHPPIEVNLPHRPTPQVQSVNKYVSYISPCTPCIHVCGSVIVVCDPDLMLVLVQQAVPWQKERNVHWSACTSYFRKRQFFALNSHLLLPPTTTTMFTNTTATFWASLKYVDTSEKNVALYHPASSIYEINFISPVILTVTETESVVLLSYNLKHHFKWNSHRFWEMTDNLFLWYPVGKKKNRKKK